MRSYPIICVAALFGGLHASQAFVGDLEASLRSKSLAQLEQRKEAIDSKIERLARYSLRGGVGPVGYRSISHTNRNAREWIRIELGQETPIDQIVLVPSIWRDTLTGFRADGFPLEFRILAGVQSDPQGAEIAAFKRTDHLLPRIAPLLVPCQTSASWIRLETTELSPRAWDGKFTLQLAEILVFSGQENVALHQPVETSSRARTSGSARRPQNLVDGFLPYLMDAYQGNQSIAFVGTHRVQDEAILTLDLQAPFAINRVHLHATDLSDTVPHASPADFGIPQKLVFEGANRADLSDADQLFEYTKQNVYDVGPIIMQRFDEVTCRYVRLRAPEPYIEANRNSSRSRIGFAEIEVFSDGRNVAKGKVFAVNYDPTMADRSVTALTDGVQVGAELVVQISGDP
ncbi:ATP-binding protein, partial [Planctomycetota bacterium]